MAPFFIGGRMEDLKRKCAKERLNELANHLDAMLLELRATHRESLDQEFNFPSLIAQRRWERRWFKAQAFIRNNMMSICV